MDQAVPVVKKTVAGRAGVTELTAHRQAVAISSEYVLPLLRSTANQDVSMWFPYVQPLPFRECCNRRRIRPYMKQLLLALTDLHSHGIVHCDIKPDNILMSGITGKLMVIDFGLATTLADRDLTQHRHRRSFTPRSGRGTRGYRAPEVLAGIDECTVASDMWSAGIVLLCLLRRRLPTRVSTAEEEADNMCKLIGTAAWKKIAKGTAWDSVTVQEWTRPENETDWRRVCEGRGSKQALLLLKSLLQPDPEARLTAQQCVVHSFMQCTYSS